MFKPTEGRMKVLVFLLVVLATVVIGCGSDQVVSPTVPGATPVTLAVEGVDLTLVLQFSEGLDAGGRSIPDEFFLVTDAIQVEEIDERWRDVVGDADESLDVDFNTALYGELKNTYWKNEAVLRTSWGKIKRMFR